MKKDEKQAWKPKVKNVREKDIRFMEIFCVITAFVAGILCVLFLFDLLQNHWFLNFILGLGVLLHVALSLLFLVKQKPVLTGLTVVFVLFYAGSLIYFNFG